MASVKVLLVDDEKDFTATLSERLELRGLEVFTASSGPEALEQAEQHKIDAVILDLQMPGMDGIDTLKHLIQKDADIQVIVLTGHATISKSVEVIKAGASEFMEKPVDIQALTEKIGAAAAQHFTLLEERSAAAIADIIKKKGW